MASKDFDLAANEARRLRRAAKRLPPGKARATFEQGAEKLEKIARGLQRGRNPTPRRAIRARERD